MNRFHMIFYVRFVSVLFSTTRASEQPCLSISFNVLLQYNPVCSWKKHLHLVSGKERVLKVAGRKFFKMSLDVLAHIVSVIVGQCLPADSATEYSFFVSVNHRLDKGIHTCEIHLINTLFTGHAQWLDQIYDKSSNVQPDCCEFWTTSDIPPPRSGEWLTCAFQCGFSCGALLPSLSGTQCIWTWPLHCSPPPLRSYRWSQHPGLGRNSSIKRMLVLIK